MLKQRQNKPRVLPEVRYHPTIQAAGAVATKTSGKQTPKTQTDPAQAPSAQKSKEGPVKHGTLATTTRPKQVPPGLGTKVDRVPLKDAEVLTQRNNLNWHVKMQNQQQSKPSPLPEVRYHPTIKAAGAVATKTTAKQTPKTRSDPAKAPSAQKPKEGPVTRGTGAATTRPEQVPPGLGIIVERVPVKDGEVLIQQRNNQDWHFKMQNQRQNKPSPQAEVQAAEAVATKTRAKQTPKTRPDSAKAPSTQEPKERPVQRGAEAAGPRPEQVPPGLGAKVDQDLVNDVEVLTRGQSDNPDWFAWRKNRITASAAHRIAHCRFVHGKSNTPPTSYLAAITGEGPRVQTRAMSWGIKMEDVAVRSYKKIKSAELGHPIAVEDCGLFIDARRPWLAASPDGMVTDRRGGKWLLEVKCPHKHRERRVEDACRTDSAFCLELLEDGPDQPPAYQLKTSHCYYTQVQCQLAVTGLTEADFVVYTLKETAIVPVTFDADLWEETVSNLEVFYRDAVLPHLRERTQRQVEM